MKSAATFLREFQRQPRFTHLPQNESNLPKPSKELPPEVRRGLDLGWKMAPISGGSQWASSCSSVCPPSSNISDLQYWYGRYPDSNNWILMTGRASTVAAISFHIDLAGEALHLLCEQSDVWRRTLRFRSGRRVFLLFSPPVAETRIPAPQIVEGVRIHLGNFIHVPPSRVSGETLRYNDLASRPLEMPDLSFLERREWTLDFDRNCEY